MRKWLVLALALLLTCAVAAAEARGTLSLGEGRYIIGEDVAPGDYLITCTETAGGQMGQAYDSLGDALDALDGGSSGIGSVFDMFGGFMEDTVDMTVEIVGNYGDVLKRRTMKTGETASITLETGTALRISDGSCTLDPVG